MKVLFAVSDEAISQNIIKQYQEDYKEIITSTNKYFFASFLARGLLINLHTSGMFLSFSTKAL